MPDFKDPQTVAEHCRRFAMSPDLAFDVREVLYAAYGRLTENMLRNGLHVISTDKLLKTLADTTNERDLTVRERADTLANLAVAQAEIARLKTLNIAPGSLSVESARDYVANALAIKLRSGTVLQVTPLFRSDDGLLSFTVTLES